MDKWRRKMQVARVQARCLSVPIKFSFTGAPYAAGLLMVHVETDDGLLGVGISRDQERFAVRELINREIAPFLIGKSPLETEKVWSDAAWEIGMSYKVRDGVVARAIGAVDQALWDIKGKYLDQPVYAYWVGLPLARQPPIPPLASTFTLRNSW
jgi:L-alanine-DL-glutamate epimerase-like enolase superfamily enzyme